MASKVLAAVATGVIALAVCCAPSPGASGDHRGHGGAGADAAPLRDLADRVGIRMGSILEPAQIGDTDHARVLAREFNALTPENALKWYSVEPSDGAFDFTGADAVVDFAEAHGMEVRGHNLVWSQDAFTPDWVKAISGEAEMRAVVQRHIDTVMARYAGRIHRWDVLNEPLQNLLDGPGTTVSDNAYRRALGEGWIGEIFRMARAQAPDAELWLNENGTDWLPARHQALLALLRQLLADGVPIDGIGLQAHRLSVDGPDPAVFTRQLRDYAALGLRVAITEVDVATSPDDPAAFARQADAYRTIVASCLAVPACEEVTTWGISDADTWLDGPIFPFLAHPTRPLLFDNDFQPKPAYDAVHEVLAAGRPSTTTSSTTTSTSALPGGGTDPTVAPPAEALPADASYTG